MNRFTQLWALSRFSLGRSDNTEAPLVTASSSDGPEGRSSSTDGSIHGFPKVLPAPGAGSFVQNRRRSTLECPSPCAPQRRAGSFRQPKQPKTPTERPPGGFCCRRVSWPDVDHQVISGWGNSFTICLISFEVSGKSEKYNLQS